ncbi:hypothetical protein ACIBH1_44660 [Nonomuraea sp. NPDC050663]|uniref:hypothetical protein n=1 Tax=Nonomuraea sp. NPDC050663 TaxID=3364370 RepID=UPI0037ACED22
MCPRRGLIQAWELQPGMIIRDWWPRTGQPGRRRSLVIRAGNQLGPIAAHGGIGYLIRTPADDPAGFIGWAGARGEVTFWLERHVDIAAVLDLADIDARFPTRSPPADQTP